MTKEDKRNIKFFSIATSVLLIVTLVLSLIHPPTAWFQDLGRHIKLGRMILDTSSVPDTNLFSYTHKDFPFVNHHWLSEVLFMLIFKLTGNSGLVLVKVFLLL